MPGIANPDRLEARKTGDPLEIAQFPDRTGQIPARYLEGVLSTISFVCAALAASAADFEYIREGAAEDVVRKTRPGYVLMGGGGDVAEAFQWMIGRSGGGDFLVLRAAGTGAYNPFVRKQGEVNSAATLILRTREASSNPEVLDKVRKAEAIFFAGGDQWNYISRWKDTPLQKAIEERIAAGVPVGGTSAGLAILAQYVFSAEFDTVRTPQALADPYDKRVAIDCCFLSIPHLENLITDSHFTARNRQGRLAVFLARLLQDGMVAAKARGLGIDEGTAVLLEPDGSAVVKGKGAAYFVETTAMPQSCERGKPVSIGGLVVSRVDRAGLFDFRKWEGGGTKQTWQVREGAFQVVPQPPPQ